MRAHIDPRLLPEERDGAAQRDPAGHVARVRGLQQLLGLHVVCHVTLVVQAACVVARAQAPAAQPGNEGGSRQWECELSNQSPVLHTVNLHLICVAPL